MAGDGIGRAHPEHLPRLLSPGARRAVDSRVVGRQVSELFVPYHAGGPRYKDFSYALPPIPLSAKDCPASVRSERDRRVERGLQTGQGPRCGVEERPAVRRGEELLLWTVLDAYNYDYIVRVGFSRDGIGHRACRATAVNLPSKPTEAHAPDPVGGSTSP